MTDTDRSDRAVSPDYQRSAGGVDDPLRRVGAIARRIRSKARRLPVEIGYFRGPLLMSKLRKRWVLFRNPHADIRFGQGNYLGRGFTLNMPRGGTFVTGDWVQFRRNFYAEVGPKGRIEIGSGSYATHDVVITCDTTITIGQRCGIGQCVSIHDGSHRYRDLDVPFLEQGYDYTEIRIEDDAQVHNKCTVINSIGTRSIIGANAVVVRPIPAYCVAVGVPARVIDYFGPPGGEPPGLSERNSDRSGAAGKSSPVASRKARASSHEERK